MFITHDEIISRSFNVPRRYGAAPVFFYFLPVPGPPDIFITADIIFHSAVEPAAAGRFAGWPAPRIFQLRWIGPRRQPVNGFCNVIDAATRAFLGKPFRVIRRVGPDTTMATAVAAGGFIGGPGWPVTLRVRDN